MDSPFAPLRSTSGLIRRQVEAAQDETVQAFERLHTEWTEHHEEANYSPADTLRRMSEIFEEAYYNFLSEDPDPHDDRIPLCTSYTFHSNVDISTGATRLLLSVLPVIDTHSIIMDADEFCEKLYRIAEVGPSRELQSYAIGLIAACNEVTRGAHYSALNTRLIPVVLDRLKERQQTMRNEYVEEDRQKFANMPTSFAHLQREERKSREDRPSRHHKTDANGSRSQDTPKKISSSRRNTVSNAHDGVPSSAPPRKRAKMNGGATHSLEEHEKTPRRKKASKATADIEPVDNGWSNSSRTQLNKITYGRHSLFPLTTVMEQRLIMQYLTPLGEFQDLLTAIIENESIDLLLYYLDLNNTRDVRLTHEAIRFIASLLVHRKFAFAFIAKRGVERLMKVVKESMASVGVSTCLYYLSYSSDVMEAVCNLSDNTLDDIVGYALYLLDHSYESGRASAAMFFTYALPYRPIIERFDKKDGRLKMYNYISTLTLIQEGPSVVLSPDDIESTIQCLVNAFALLRSYVEAHLHFKLLHILNKNPQIQVPSIVRNLASNKSLKLEPEVLRQVVQVMLKIFSYKVGWKPIAELDRLGFIDLLSRVLNIIFDQSYTGRTEIVRYALEFVWIVTTFPSMRMRILQRIQFKSTLENSVFR
ncbi:hypothetical protein QR680_002398 [Steinernema hermaphroditum]|uniref:Uncharacterized protein n=1 Tax=Steinernema hermaphroditum TaxID=289476 RepID=A0AA39H598_9BILA|nr:hypothetical protein QR680_002398 [Steinernema hermaphroditum]